MIEDVKLPEDNEGRLKMWEGRVKVARRFQEQVGNQKTVSGTGKRRWDQNVAAMAGDFNSQTELGDEAIDVNVVRSTLKTALPALKLTYPKITVNPTVLRFKDINNVRAAEKVSAEVNYWLRELDVRKEVGKIVTDSQATNVGYLYLGRTDSKADGYDASGERREFVPTIRHKQPFVRRHPPKMLLVPPGYCDLEEAPWIDIIFRKPLRHVCDKFGLDPEDIPTVETITMDDDAKRDPSIAAWLETVDSKYVEVHNCWCKETKKVYVFVVGMDRFLEEPKAWPWEVEGFPVVMHRPEEIPDQFYGTPPLTYVMPQQKELNAARTAMRKRFNRSKSTIFAGADIEDQVIAAYQKAQDGEIIKTGLGPSDDLRRQLMPTEGLPMDTHSLQYGQMVKADMLEIQGLSAEQRGSGDPNVDSATASANIQRNANIRTADVADSVKQVYLKVARKLWMLVADGPEISVVRRVEGPIAGAFAELKYSTKELRGEFQFEMEFAPKIPDTDAEKMQGAMLRYNLFRADPLVDPKELVLDVYKAFGELNPEAKLTFLRSPDEEHKMFMQGLHSEAHERDDHQSHVAAHDAFLDQLNQALEQFEEQAERQMPGGSQGDTNVDRIRTAVILLTTHLQDHVRKVKELAGPGAKAEPVSKNVARRGIAAAGNETEAELNGNPMGPVN